MKLLLESVKVLDTNSDFNQKIVDILIEDGRVAKIGTTISVSSDCQTFKQEGAAISPSFLDMNFHVFEPGLEYREDFKSALAAAAKGGFGHLAILPNTNPPIDSKTQIEFVKSISSSALTNVFPLGAVSHQIEGKDLSEIYDMYQCGAVAFTDGSYPISHAGLMEKALLYVKKINGLVFSNPNNIAVSNVGQMNEGVQSTILGLHAAPALAEELMVVRDLYLLEHTDSRLHFSAISTKKSVNLIRAAKVKGLNVTASVNVANLFYDDSQLASYDTNFKVQPHLRTKEDVIALLEALKDGTIDVISSGHTPLHKDEKKVEFENAEFGMSTIDCAFSVARTATKDYLSEMELIEKLTNGYVILQKSIPKIARGEKALFTLYNLENSFIFLEKNILSKGKNNPFIGEELQGEIIGIINGTKTNLL